MVPAIRVFNPSVGKRVIVLMPDSPPASLAQLSLLPASREVTTPSPVTTTTGRPILSLPAVIASLLNRAVQRGRDLHSANGQRRLQPLVSILCPSAAQARSRRRLEIDYHGQAQSWRVRYS